MILVVNNPEINANACSLCVYKKVQEHAVYDEAMRETSLDSVGMARNGQTYISLKHCLCSKQLWDTFVAPRGLAYRRIREKARVPEKMNELLKLVGPKYERLSERQRCGWSFPQDHENRVCEPDELPSLRHPTRWSITSCGSTYLAGRVTTIQITNDNWRNYGVYILKKGKTDRPPNYGHYHRKYRSTSANASS